MFLERDFTSPVMDRSSGDTGDAPSPAPSHHNDSLDDIFGSAPSSPTITGTQRPENHSFSTTEPSDIPRLRAAHSTNGYREGLTIAKGKTVQEGFDEGYSLGATMGLRVGKVLGVLEGIQNALAKAALEKAVLEESGQRKDVPKSEGDAEVGCKWLETWDGTGAQKMQRMAEKAKEELRTEIVFGREYWGEDGIWKFAVEGEEEEGREVTFRDVVDAHPLLWKWERIVEAEAELWGVDLNGIGDEGEGVGEQS